MSKYIGPKCRLSRREKFDLSHKIKDVSKKCNMRSLPGGLSNFSNSSYNFQLREKQKLKRVYGIREKYLFNLYKKICKSSLKTSDALINALERRLDNVVYRMGFGTTRNQTRQFVVHQFIKVNGKICDIPSYLIKDGDKIEIVDKAKSFVVINQAIKKNKSSRGYSWLDVDYELFLGTFNESPISSIVTQFNMQYIIEWLSRR